MANSNSSSMAGWPSQEAHESGSRHRKNRAMVFNTFQLSSEGFNYIDNPHEIRLPQLPDTTEPSTQQALRTSKPTRVSRGSQALPVIRNLLSDQTKWFEIENPDDYQYPGVFRHEHPKRVAYCEDITALPFYDPGNEHFMFEDIQLGKGHTRGTRKTTANIDGKQEEICYKIAPCKGVKVCSADGCSYVASTRESKPCPHHLKSQLESSGNCPVDFFYVWPTASTDNRRWIGGLVRSDSMVSDNFHNHPINPPSKIPVKVEADIRKAIQANPHLKTSEIMIGKDILLIFTSLVTVTVIAFKKLQCYSCFMYCAWIQHISRERARLHARCSFLGSDTQGETKECQDVCSS